MGSCAITAFPFDSFGDGWEGAFSKVTGLDSNFQELGRMFQFVSSNSTVSEQNVEIYWASGSTSSFSFLNDGGGGENHLRVQIVPGAISVGTGPIVANTIIPCDSDYPHYNGEACIPFKRSWEMSIGVSSGYANVWTGSSDRVQFFGDVDSVITVGCNPKMESVYYPTYVNNGWSSDIGGGPFGNQYESVHLNRDYSNGVKLSGGSPVNYKPDFGGAVCEDIELELFDAQGFGWHIPGKYHYTTYTVDDGTELLIQGTLVGDKPKKEKLALPQSATAMNYFLRLAGRNDPNEWAHHAVFSTEDSSPESVTIKPGNQIEFSVTNCEVSVTSVKTYQDTIEYGAFDDRGGDYVDFAGASPLSHLTPHSIFSNGKLQLASSSTTSPASAFDISSLMALVGIAAVGMVVGMFAERRRSIRSRAIYSAVDESSTHAAPETKKKSVLNVSSTAGLV